jgi:hypothetical protein
MKLNVLNITTALRTGVNVAEFFAHIFVATSAVKPCFVFHHSLSFCGGAGIPRRDNILQFVSFFSFHKPKTTQCSTHKTIFIGAFYLSMDAVILPARAIISFKFS